MWSDFKNFKNFKNKKINLLFINWIHVEVLHISKELPNIGLIQTRVDLLLRKHLVINEVINPVINNLLDNNWKNINNWKNPYKKYYWILQIWYLTCMFDIFNFVAYQSWNLKFLITYLGFSSKRVINPYKILCLPKTSTRFSNLSLLSESSYKKEEEEEARSFLHAHRQTKNED
jgi:hypothetical protein